MSGLKSLILLDTDSYLWLRVVSHWTFHTSSWSRNSSFSVWATGELAESFEDYGFIWQKQEPNDPKTLVVLRDIDTELKETIKNKKKVTLRTPETDEVQKYRKNLHDINSEITKHCIHLDLSDDQIEVLQRQVSNGEWESDEIDNDVDPQGDILSIDFSRVQLRRIFSRGNMTKGGRFYGGWWQSIPSIYRRHLCIDGKKTTEVDFSGIALRIIYAQQKGAQLPDDIDPYDLKLDSWDGGSDPRRKHI